MLALKLAAAFAIVVTGLVVLRWVAAVTVAPPAPAAARTASSGGELPAIRSPAAREPTPEPTEEIDHMAAYDEVCKKTPTAAYCGLPLYWPAPQFVVSPKAGMHRFSWDLKFDPVSAVDLVPAGDEDATGAVPGRTYPNYNVPWVPPGRYTVRLTVDGITKTQPMTVRLDPRVRIAPEVLATLNTLSTSLYREAVAAHRAHLMKLQAVVAALKAHRQRHPGVLIPAAVLP